MRSSREHQNVDAEGIHTKICSMLAVVRAPSEEIGSEEDRAKRNKIAKANQRKLVDLTRDEASKFLVLGQFELAVRLSTSDALPPRFATFSLKIVIGNVMQVPGALQSLRFSLSVYGEGHIELVPAYLLLAEANLGKACK